LDETSFKNADPSVAKAVIDEIRREKNSLVMIASENYASRAVIEAQANVMTNKYAEGYPGRRYYGGCEYVDTVETLAIERARALFGAEHANVQPHSGSQANMAVYFSFLKPGDTILGLELSHGGHLTHGSTVSFSGKLYKTRSYGLNPKSQRIDYDQIHDLAQQHHPKIIIAGASAYPRTIDFRKFKEIADSTGALVLADMAHIAGLVATSLHPSPVGVVDFVTSTTHKTLRGPRGGIILSDHKYAQRIDRGLFPGIQGGPLMHIIAAKAVAFGEALKPAFKIYQAQVLKNARILAEQLMDRGFDLVSGGTDNHLILIDLTHKGITGLEAEEALGGAGIVANKNSVPFDTRSPRITSGLRLGTPALTTRGFKDREMEMIAGLIQRVLEKPKEEKVIRAVRAEVLDLCKHFPIYSFLDPGEQS
jgi:glycine hydroxymethyltransferase